MFKKESHIVGTAIVLMLIGLISFPVTGLAGDSSGRQGCFLQGTWLGYGPGGAGETLGTVEGQSRDSGNVILENLNLDVTLGGIFPAAIRHTALRGTWERIGPNTFRRWVIGLAVDENGATVWIGKMIGTSTLSDACNTDYTENTLEVFLPNQNPSVDEPLFAIPLGGHYGYRMR